MAVEKYIVEKGKDLEEREDDQWRVEWKEENILEDLGTGRKRKKRRGKKIWALGSKFKKKNVLE